jgi:hypothetical protein
MINGTIMEDYAWIWILSGAATFLLFLIWFFWKSVYDQSQSNTLISSFNKLGDLSGKTKSQIEEKVGQASIVNRSGDGGLICIWSSPNFNISIAFNENEEFTGIINEL